MLAILVGRLLFSIVLRLFTIKNQLNMNAINHILKRKLFIDVRKCRLRAISPLSRLYKTIFQLSMFEMLTGMRKRIHYIRQANLNDMYEKNQVIYLLIDL